MGGGGGVQVNLTQKALTLFLVLSLFYRSRMVNLKKKLIIFEGSRGGPTFSRWGVGVVLLPQGSNCLFPIETCIPCEFPEVPNPVSLLWIRT